MQHLADKNRSKLFKSGLSAWAGSEEMSGKKCLATLPGVIFGLLILRM